VAAHRIGGGPERGRHAARRVLPAWLKPRRGRQLPRQITLGLLEDAMGRAQGSRETVQDGDTREAG
jgi:hypothetical protein